MIRHLLSYLTEAYGGDNLPITTTPQNVLCLDLFLFPIIPSGTENDMDAAQAFQLYGLIMLRYVQTQKLNQITADLHKGQMDDRAVASLLLEHGRVSRSILFCKEKISALYMTVPPNRQPNAWGPYMQPFLEPSISHFDATAYTNADGAFRRAVQAGFDPTTIDPFYDRAVPIHRLAMSHKKD
jgi:hypothetical protein